MKSVFALTLVLLCGTVPASAKEASGWVRSGDRISIPTADISFPVDAAAAMLVKTAEFSHKGEGLDNVAQYESADRALFATIYVYRPAYPDAALSAYRTDLTIRERFGSSAVAEHSVVAVPGHSGSVIRMVYPDGATKDFNDGAPVATAAALLHVSAWIVKVRVTAPAARRADVIAALDALVAGIKVGRKAYVYPARPIEIAAPCPGTDTVAMLLPKSDKTGAGVLAAAMVSATVPLEPDEKKSALPPPFPNNGLDRVCVRGSFPYGNGKIDLLQPIGNAVPKTVIGVLSDAGTMLVLDRALVTPGYDLKVTQIGVANVYGSFDNVPSTAQIAELLSGREAPGNRRTASVSFAADGTKKIELSTGTLD